MIQAKARFQSLVIFIIALVPTGLKGHCPLVLEALMIGDDVMQDVLGAQMAGLR